MDSSILESVIVPRAAASKIADENANSDANSDSLIGILADLLVHHFCPFNRFVPDISRHFLSVFQGGGKALAGFGDFFSGDICGGGHQRARISGKFAYVMVG